MATIGSADPHHCKCFYLHKDDIEYFRKYLLSVGFADGLQMPRAEQLFGYMLRIKDKLQFHIKVMQDGQIESEMEPPPAYPLEHVNQEYSYSAHRETKQILRLSRAVYGIADYIPDTCKRPQSKEPDNPTHASTIVAGLVLGVATVAILSKLFGDDDESA